MQTVSGYVCRACGAGFGRMRDLAEHKKIHTVSSLGPISDAIKGYQRVLDDPSGIAQRDRLIVDRVIEKIVKKVMCTPVRELQELIAGKKQNPERAKAVLIVFMLKALAE